MARPRPAPPPATAGWCGIFVRTAQPLPLNETLTLRFRLPEVLEEFQVQGKVVWSNSQAGGTYPQGMGIRFLDLPSLMGWVPGSSRTRRPEAAG